MRLSECCSPLPDAQAHRRGVRSYPEELEEGEAVIKGSMERTTPAVAASERRKSLKLVRERERERERG